MTQDKLKTKDDTKMYLGAVYISGELYGWQVSVLSPYSLSNILLEFIDETKKKNEQYIFIKISLPSVSFLPFSVSRGKNSRFRPPFRCVNFYSQSVHSATILLSRCILSLIYCHDYKLVLTSISVDSCKRQSYKLNMIV